VVGQVQQFLEWVHADQVEEWIYDGRAKLTAAQNGSMGRANILLCKTSQPSKLQLQRSAMVWMSTLQSLLCPAT